MAKTSKSAIKVSCLQAWMKEKGFPKPSNKAEDIEEKGITHTYRRRNA